MNKKGKAWTQADVDALVAKGIKVTEIGGGRPDIMRQAVGMGPGPGYQPPGAPYPFGERLISDPSTVPRGKGQGAKYGSKKVEFQGRTFDSHHELEHWHRLTGREQAGEIYALRHQVLYRLEVAGILICTLTVDFTYRLATTHELVVEDTKSGPTRKKESYRIKRKLMAAIHGITVVEIMKGGQPWAPKKREPRKKF